MVGQRVANAGGDVTGGQNGILMTEHLRFGALDLGQGRGFYALAAVCLLLTYLGFRAFLASRTGLVLRGIRDNEDRVDLLGYSVPAIKRRAFVLSAAVAALAARVTTKSVHRLALAPGLPVYAVIKSVSFERS